MTCHVITRQVGRVLQGEAPFVGALLTDDRIQWYWGDAKALSEVTPNALTDAEHWLNTNVCVLRCSLPVHAEVGHTQAYPRQQVSQLV